MQESNKGGNTIVVNLSDNYINRVFENPTESFERFYGEILKVLGIKIIGEIDEVLEGELFIRFSYTNDSLFNMCGYIYNNFNLLETYVNGDDNISNYKPETLYGFLMDNVEENFGNYIQLIIFIITKKINK